MDRRSYLFGLASLTIATAGCSALPGDSGPDPTVIDHFRGDVALVESYRELLVETDGHAIVATLENTGYDATVDVSVYWVPRTDVDPTGRTHEELVDLGYELEARERVQIDSGDRETVRVEGAPSSNFAGYYIRKNNLTFGGTVENRGETGDVAVRLLDTSERGNPQRLDSTVVELAGGERRDVTFTTTKRFDVFRIEASPAN